ncbi:uncharacterized protein Z518_07063 [Rhinocladiella mackenziei CBS 650.93]|uniref:Ribonuclease H2 subunit B n=1 Tax=Rhinocladiella mackenziei CBS 650.93 TaxID=1442369 RepID=A0A0D2J3J9_9EURO|nr:uncharacterized protein Z518_07063 [Rhinocladiella mackenziei CBS 650.93]KIX03510.1 hypothetical protein Z518_07063 [Rhinocladiella mackenziei CBS 650.93]
MTIETRSRTNSPVKNSTEIPTAESNPQRKPLQHFILPKDVSDRARFILLRHPRDLTTQRFLFCPENGLFQFTKINAPSNDPRSLLFAGCGAGGEINSTAGESTGIKSKEALSNGYVSRGAEFFVATPFDLAFVLIPLVTPAKTPTEKMLFQPLDDILEQHTEGDKHLRYICEQGRTMIGEAMSKFCDTIEAGDEQMYRPNENKTLKMIMDKAETAIRNGLPASLEDQFVTRVLETPVLSVKREETIMSTRSEPLALDGNDSALEGFDSQSSAESSAPSAVFSEVSTTSSISAVVPGAMPPELRDLQKQSIALEFILASYLPSSIAERLKASLAAKNSPINFTPLEEHLKSLAALRAEAWASRSMGDFSRKRDVEDEEAAGLRADKKRKQEEEDRKKKMGESKGVRELKKVNVSGMKKMSDFFAKKPAAKANG